MEDPDDKLCLIQAIVIFMHFCFPISNQHFSEPSPPLLSKQGVTLWRCTMLGHGGVHRRAAHSDIIHEVVQVSLISWQPIPGLLHQFMHAGGSN
ncbi:hypothetical protein O6P43_010749 [Quillaja saponaria]|uniref:Uncharacterized protein n=1 Tax=Quillaja saponaria TaxID=32244 RepID=A0AAD7Q132_QUISA|nr:hypothetical protein O6P43_010749 [Quillaja saponaria]